MRTNGQIRVAFEYAAMTPGLPAVTYLVEMQGPYSGSPWELADNLMTTRGAARYAAVSVQLFAAGRWWLMDRLMGAASSVAA